MKLAQFGSSMNNARLRIRLSVSSARIFYHNSRRPARRERPSKIPNETSVTISELPPSERSGSGIPVIGTAAFTFWKMTYAIIKLARKSRGRSPRESVLRCTALADSSMAMLTLERTMIASVDPDGADSHFFVVMTACLGMAVFLAVLWAGIHLLLRAARMKKAR